MRPRVGCRQRTSASMPSSRPVETSTTGRYSRYGVPCSVNVGSGWVNMVGHSWADPVPSPAGTVLT